MTLKDNKTFRYPKQIRLTLQALWCRGSNGRVVPSQTSHRSFVGRLSHELAGVVVLQVLGLPKHFLGGARHFVGPVLAQVLGNHVPSAQKKKL